MATSFPNREGRRLGVSSHDLQQDLKEWGRIHQGIDYSKPSTYDIIENDTGSYVTFSRQTNVTITKVAHKRLKSKISRISYASTNQEETIDLGANQPLVFTNAFYGASGRTEKTTELDRENSLLDLVDDFNRFDYIEEQEVANFSFNYNLDDLGNTDGGMLLISAFWLVFTCWFWKFVVDRVRMPILVKDTIRGYAKNELTLEQATMFLNSNFGFSWHKSCLLLEPTKNPNLLPGTAYTMLKRPVVESKTNRFTTFLDGSALLELRNIVIFFTLAFFSLCFFLDSGFFGIALELLFAFLAHRCWKLFRG